MDENLIEAPPVIRPQFTELQELGLSLDQDGHLDEDVACRKCEYNLRGLALDRNCPECETAVEQTINRSTLRFSDPAWLRRVRSGLTFMIVFSFAWILLSTFVYVRIILTSPLGSINYDNVNFIASILAFGLVLTQIFVWLRLTTIELVIKPSDSNISARRLAKTFLIASSLVNAVSMLFDSSPYGLYIGDIIKVQLFNQISWWAKVLASIFIIVGLFALFDYGRSLARRFPADRLAKHTRLVMWGYMVPVITFTIWFIALEIVKNQELIDYPSMAINNVARLLNVLFGIPALVFGILGIVLLFKYRSQFSKAMKLATKQSTLRTAHDNPTNSIATIDPTNTLGY